MTEAREAVSPIPLEQRLDRWLPRSEGGESPLSISRPAVRDELLEAPAPTATADIEEVARVWFEGTGCDPLDQRAFTRYAAGLSDRAMAEELGVSRRVVHTMIDRAARALVRRARDLEGPTRERAALSLWLAEESQPVIAEVLHVPVGGVQRALGRVLRDALSGSGPSEYLAIQCREESPTPHAGRRRVVVVG
jgi:hypothetical protein